MKGVPNQCYCYGGKKVKPAQSNKLSYTRDSGARPKLLTPLFI